MHTFSLTAADEKYRFILHREDKNIIQPACVWRNLSALAPKSQQMRSKLNSSEPTTASCSTDYSLPFVSHYMGWITPQPGHWGEVLASQRFGRLGFDSSFDERSKQSLFSKPMCLFICSKKRILQRCHGENTTTGFIWMKESVHVHWVEVASPCLGKPLAWAVELGMQITSVRGKMGLNS